MGWLNAFITVNHLKYRIPLYFQGTLNLLFSENKSHPQNENFNDIF